MIPESVRREALDYLQSMGLDQIPSLQNTLLQDGVWQSAAFEEIKRSFLLHFDSLGEEQAKYLLFKSFNDVFLVERNHIACPLW